MWSSNNAASCVTYRVRPSSHSCPWLAASTAGSPLCSMRMRFCSSRVDDTSSSCRWSAAFLALPTTEEWAFNSSTTDDARSASPFTLRRTLRRTAAGAAAGTAGASAGAPERDAEGAFAWDDRAGDGGAAAAWEAADAATRARAG